MFSLANEDLSSRKASQVQKRLVVSNSLHTQHCVASVLGYRAREESKITEWHIEILLHVEAGFSSFTLSNNPAVRTDELRTVWFCPHFADDPLFPKGSFRILR